MSRKGTFFVVKVLAAPGFQGALPVFRCVGSGLFARFWSMIFNPAVLPMSIEETFVIATVDAIIVYHPFILPFFRFYKVKKMRKAYSL